MVRPRSNDYKDWIDRSGKGISYYCKICEEDLKINTIWGDRAHQNSNEHKNRLEGNNNLLIIRIMTLDKAIPSYVEQTLHFIYKYFSKSQQNG